MSNRVILLSYLDSEKLQTLSAEIEMVVGEVCVKQTQNSNCNDKTSLGYGMRRGGVNSATSCGRCRKRSNLANCPQNSFYKMKELFCTNGFRTQNFDFAYLDGSPTDSHCPTAIGQSSEGSLAPLLDIPWGHRSTRIAVLPYQEVKMFWQGTGTVKRINGPIGSGTIYPWSSNLKGPNGENR